MPRSPATPFRQAIGPRGWSSSGSLTRGLPEGSPTGLPRAQVTCLAFMTRAESEGGDGPPSGSPGAPSADPGTPPPRHCGFPPRNVSRGSPLPSHHLIKPCLVTSPFATHRHRSLRGSGKGGDEGLPHRWLPGASRRCVGSRRSRLPPGGGDAANLVGSAGGRGPDPCPGRRCRAGARSHNQRQASLDTSLDALCALPPSPQDFHR